MNCLKCDSRTDVYDTRLIVGRGTRRKRKCTSCLFRFATIEVVDDVMKIREPKPKVAKVPRPKKVRAVRTKRSAAVKPRSTDDDMYEDYGISDEVWDVARELGIEGFK